MSIPQANPGQTIPCAPASPSHARARIGMVALCLALAATAAYLNSFRVPFIFDDIWSIPNNESIRSLGSSPFPPNTNGETVSGRPLVNVTLAINYAISRNGVWSYHAANLLIHIAAGLALFGLVRRALLLPAMPGRFRRDSLWLAAVVAALWMLHPLQTESVTYIVQRAESLMGLFYLLTLYCFARANGGSNEGILTVQPEGPHYDGVMTPSRKNFWLGASLASCLLGMASKEVMVSAPLLVFLFDRAFVSGSFREAWGRRRAFYVLLASTWVVSIALALHAGSRGGTAGFDGEITPWTYLLTQCKAIPHYLRLAFWPRGLTFDYGTSVVASPEQVWAQALLLVALFAGSVWALVRHPKAGLVGIFFFAVLAPTSSFIPVATQTMTEHRMYLPLAAVVLMTTLALWRLAGRRALAALCAVSLALGALSFARNKVYESDLALWGDTLAKLPGSHRAHNNLASALADTGRAEEAISHCIEAVRLKPDFPQAYNNHGYALSKMGRFNDALWYYDKALSFGQAGMELILCNRGFALYKLGRLDDAIKDYRGSLRIRPAYAETLSNYSNVLCDIGAHEEALASIDHALRLEPDFAAAWNNRGNIFAAIGKNPDEALRCYKRAVELDPGMVLAIDNVARYSLLLGRPADALPYFEMHARLEPGKALVHQGWGNALMLLDRQAESMPHFRRALELDPNLFASNHNLGIALLDSGQPADALPYFEKALTLQPDSAPLRHNYAEALGKLGRLDDAIAQEREALRLQPNFSWAREQLDAYLRQQTSPAR